MGGEIEPSAVGLEGVRHPNHQQTHLVVAGDGDVHVSQGRVGVAKRNAGDVDVGRLSQRLVVGTGVRHDQEAGLPEGGLDLIGECSWGEATVEGGGASGGGELQHSSLGTRGKQTLDS